MAVTLRERIKQIEKARPKIEEKIALACKNATLRAIEKAAEKTPPNQENQLSGTNTRTGKLKENWAVASKPIPVREGNTYTTVLANDMKYASFVNNGHRMDKHFVPGLYINSAGMLEYDPSENTGIVVGTKTAFVKGLFMVDEAKEEYKRVLRQELKDIGEILE